MSKSVNSPTARLLQSSRLFSLPRPLPQNAPSNLSATGASRGSDTATTLYPTHQAVITPASSLHRGDWGLKRALPSKATRNTNTPVIRIKAGDNWEHITDFESAADHERTLAKWNEMGIPLMQRKPRQQMSDPSPYEKPGTSSVFEDRYDNTDPDVSNDILSDKTRWKYKGPWLAGMLQGDFDIWVEKSVGKRSAEWREFLRKDHVETLQREQRQLQREQGELSSSEPGPLPVISDADLANHEKSLRDAHTRDGLSSRLTQLLTRFLDLPALTTSSASAARQNPAYANTRSPELRGVLANTYQVASGPPSTHPSAGLSHTRSAAYLPNHPVHGPQAFATPVPARVLRPKEMTGAPDTDPKLGVGGFVAKDPLGSSMHQKGSDFRARRDNRDKDDPDALVNHLDPEREGGNVIQVHPRYAEVGEDGRVSLVVERGDREALAVKSGDVAWIERMKDQNAMGGRRQAPVGFGAGFGAGGNGFAAQPGTAGNANYGSGLPDRRRAAAQELNREGAGYPAARSAPRVQGFEGGERQGRQGQQHGGQEALDRIRELMEQQRGGR